MSDKPEKPEGDPFSQMVQFYDDWTKTWSGAASEMVSSKGFADSVAQQLESTLSMTQLMRRQMSEIMEQSLQQMSLPTRKEIATLDLEGTTSALGEPRRSCNRIPRPRAVRFF